MGSWLRSRSSGTLAGQQGLAERLEVANRLDGGELAEGLELALKAGLKVAPTGRKALEPFGINLVVVYWPPIRSRSRQQGQEILRQVQIISPVANGSRWRDGGIG